MEKLSCVHCNGELWRTKKDVKRNVSGNYFCNKSCRASFNATITLTLRCCQCQKEFQRPINSYRSKSGKQFCSSSCSATFTNKTAIKRPRKMVCKKCPKPILSGYIYCENCYIAKHRLANKTLLEAIGSRNDANKYTGIRGNARKIFKDSAIPLCCLVCGYTNHVEISHKRGIASFPLETLVSEVNSIDNLMPLCPNHHWEFDNGFLML
jgi:hypothetical protein